MFIIKICFYNLLFYALLFVFYLEYWNVQRFISKYLPETEQAKESNENAVFILDANVKEQYYGEELLNELKKGGYVLFIRHFKTLHKDITNDLYNNRRLELPMKFYNDCSWQRPLSNTGVIEAKEAGKIIKYLQIPIGTVYSSPYCRTMETAINLFEREPIRDIKLIYRKGDYPADIAHKYIYENYLKAKPEPGVNNVVIGHRPPMDDVGGVEEGETVIFKYENDQLYLKGRIPVSNWLIAKNNIEMFGKDMEEQIRTIRSEWYADPKESYPSLEEIIGE